jgi:hypothetical protein
MEQQERESRAHTLAYNSRDAWTQRQGESQEDFYRRQRRLFPKSFHPGYTHPGEYARNGMLNEVQNIYYPAQQFGYPGRPNTMLGNKAPSVRGLPATSINRKMFSGIDALEGVTDTNPNKEIIGRVRDNIAMSDMARPQNQQGQKLPLRYSVLKSEEIFKGQEKDMREGLQRYGAPLDVQVPYRSAYYPGYNTVVTDTEHPAILAHEYGHSMDKSFVPRAVKHEGAEMRAPLIYRYNKLYDETLANINADKLMQQMSGQNNRDRFERDARVTAPLGYSSYLNSISEIPYNPGRATSDIKFRRLQDKKNLDTLSKNPGYISNLLQPLLQEHQLSQPIPPMATR